MLKRFLPRQDNFFQLFQEAVDKLADVAQQFAHLLNDLPNQQLYVDLIERQDNEADKITLRTFELMHKSFITPFDRYDIHALTSSIDDIIYLINRMAQRFPFYALQSVPDEMIHLTELGVRATRHVKQAVYLLHALKNSDAIFKECKALDKLENEGHRFVIAGEKKLFLEENDFKQFFKLKEIYANSKLVLNKCQDVGMLIKGIILEYS